ncbi:4Fe-4S ferredoxin [Desulfuribacillus stibiiarsenatis]|uniref:4Fe-4S ferredoxin n=1 Tax=Desulfuribacillus stibiiarsenatis TaxID=1390249 RepID=A0A1E5L940_9FIRM|nr:4Fe-4S binding protein [Desulfuribacillus stibiiarsenatis]OEH86665.1 4Fe-4S ferredoxin [Desulfuribacillus stibiiarsenatis]
MQYVKNVAKIEIHVDKCIGCGLCVMVCPHGVINIQNRKAYVEYRDHCIECGACDKNCPVRAIQVESGVG